MGMEETRPISFMEGMEGSMCGKSREKKREVISG